MANNIYVLRAAVSSSPDFDYWVEQLYPELQEGRARFGNSRSQTANLNRIRDGIIEHEWRNISETEKSFWSYAAFMLDVDIGDYLLYLDLPERNYNCVARAVGHYEFTNVWDSEKRGDFRHVVPCNFIAAFDKSHPVIRSCLEGFSFTGAWTKVPMNKDFESLIRFEEDHLKDDTSIEFEKWISANDNSGSANDFVAKQSPVGPTRKIKAAEIISDLLGDLNPVEIMKKHNLSMKALETVIRKLVDSRKLKISDIGRKFPSLESASSVTPVRKIEREYIELALPIYDVKNPRRRGVIRNISEKGMGIAGIEAREGEIIEFVIPADILLGIGPISMETACRWIGLKGKSRYFSGGFEITVITDDNLHMLRELIRFLSLGS